MTEQNNTMKKLLLNGLFMFLAALSLSAQDSLFIYKNGQIIYSSQVDQIDSAAFHPPGYWAEKRSEAIYTEIQSHPELSIFLSMLDLSGYSSKLDNKTVWAPVNAALAGIDRSNLDLVKQVVENHLSNGIYYQGSFWTTLGKVTMLNQKRMELTKLDDNFFLDGKKIRTRNIQTFSGLLNILEGCIPVRPTLWEYLNNSAVTDSMCLFLRSFTKKNVRFGSQGQRPDKCIAHQCRSIPQT